jgi:hypothetical protein
MEQNKSFYTVVPAYIRDDERLSLGCMFLFGDIAALCNRTGECWASNSYLSKINKVDKKTISKWVSMLEEAGHITTKVERNELGEVIARYIKIGIPMAFSVPTPPHATMDYINTSLINTVDTTIVSATPKQEPRKVKVGPEAWESAKTELQKTMAFYVKNFNQELYEHGTAEQISGFFRQYSKYFSTLLATAGNSDCACQAMLECDKYFKAKRFPWGLKALSNGWSDFVGQAMQTMRKNKGG